MNDFDQLGCDCVTADDDMPMFNFEQFMDQCPKCYQPFYEDCWYTRPATGPASKEVVKKPKMFSCKICLKEYPDEEVALAGDHGIRRNHARVNCHDLYVHTTRGGNRLMKRKVPRIRVQKVRNNAIVKTWISK